MIMHAKINALHNVGRAMANFAGMTMYSTCQWRRDIGPLARFPRRRGDRPASMGALTEHSGVPPQARG